MKKSEKSLKRVRYAVLIFAVLFLSAGIFLGLTYFKIIKLNHPDGIKGADVSAYQGEIDWDILSKNLDFVFVKATEGSSYTDDYFKANFSGAMSEGLLTGAYHFFSYDSSGRSQAEHFISTVGYHSGMLPPVIDVEFYGKYYKDPKPAEDVKAELTEMISALEEYYGVKPIIYCTAKAKRLYGEIFGDCPLWIRNVYFSPVKNDWLFWQYSDTEELDGYSGDEKYIDMNVFNGDYEKLKGLAVR